jgi:hypothetical protein
MSLSNFHISDAISLSYTSQYISIHSYFGECNAHHLCCKVGYFCRGGKVMNEPSASPIYVVLLFILRCFVPLAILFGISYLLRRMGLVAIESPEPIEEPTIVPDKAAASPTIPSKKTQKRKAAPPPGKKPAGRKSVEKKPARKPKTGSSRSRAK